jgi:ParB family chromosome partitioning protein
MATAKKKSTAARKRKRAPPRRKTPRKAQPRTRGIEPADCTLDLNSDATHEVRKRIADSGGQVLGCYSEPLGGNALVLAALPIDSVEPTPFQRDLSDTHHKKLSEVINSHRAVSGSGHCDHGAEARLLDAERSSSS